MSFLRNKVSTKKVRGKDMYTRLREAGARCGNCKHATKGTAGLECGLGDAILLYPQATPTSEDNLCQAWDPVK